MNRTMFIGTNLYYSQEFVDDRINELKVKDKEIERLNNIINELEKMLEQTIENSAVQPHIEMAEYTLKELKELKGSGSND